MFAVSLTVVHAGDAGLMTAPFRVMDGVAVGLWSSAPVETGPATLLAMVR